MRLFRTFLRLVNFFARSRTKICMGTKSSRNKGRWTTKPLTYKFADIGMTIYVRTVRSSSPPLKLLREFTFRLDRNLRGDYTKKKGKARRLLSRRGKPRLQGVKTKKVRCKYVYTRGEEYSHMHKSYTPKNVDKGT